MKKKLFFAAVAIVALASCADNEFVGEVSPNLKADGESAIVFNSGANAITRADYLDADAAAKLNNNFVVEGVKSDGTATSGVVVFNNYNVNYAASTANTTTSNTDNWEYVAQTTSYWGENSTSTENSPISAQTIKYWDYSKSQYDFIAYSTSNATVVYTAADYALPANSNSILVTEITPSTMDAADKNNDGTNDGAYSVTGKAENLAKFYIADLVTVYRDKDADKDALGDYNKTVKLTFRSLSAKVRVGLYETVPGYSVKSVVFYTDASTAATDGKAHLYTTGTEVFNEEGTYTVYYPTIGSGNKTKTDYNKAHVAFKAGTSATSTSKDKSFGGFSYVENNNETFKNGEGTETGENIYLGRSSNNATYAGVIGDHFYTTVIPNETGAVLNLKVDYTLVSTDGSGETIKVTGATAQVPSKFAEWKSGYAYTYLFKISQNTNGLSNPDIDIAGLYPITFDAVVTESEDHVQETITTVSTPSITTYAKGEIVTTNNEYTAGSNIYVVMQDASELEVGTNANLYTVTLEGSAAQDINEASVANALANGTQDPTNTWTVQDANNKKMVVVKSSLLSHTTSIAADDSPNGNAIPVNGAKFTPAASTYSAASVSTGDDVTGLYELSGTDYVPTSDNIAQDSKTYYTQSSGAGIYVFEYIDATANKKYYKIIRVVAN